MPLVDRRTRSVVLRIVYDGPPEAGRTTNLRQLCARLSLARRGTPARTDNRELTQFFDWLDTTGRWLGGRRVRCQLVTVPGQIQLVRRRRHILDSADAVVFVADSRATAAPETRAALRSLARGLGARGDVPLVLQANKQDLPEAQPPEQLRAALDLAARVPAVGAQATAGTGVLETFMLAVRLAVDHVRARLVAGELGEGDEHAGGELWRARGADAPEAIEAPEAPEAIAQAADLALRPAAPDAMPDATTGPAPEITEMRTEMTTDMTSDATIRAAEDEAIAATLEGPQAAAGEVAGNAASDAMTEAARRSREAVTRRLRAVSRSPEASPVEPAAAPATGTTLPDGNIATGLVWPPKAGRAALRDLDLQRSRGAELVALGRAMLRCGPWLLCCTRDAWHDIDLARRALLAAVAQQPGLAGVAPELRTLAVADAGDGAYRLWQLAAVPRTLAELALVDRDAAAVAVARANRDLLPRLTAIARLGEVELDVGLETIDATGSGYVGGAWPYTAGSQQSPIDLPALALLPALAPTRPIARPATAPRAGEPGATGSPPPPSMPRVATANTLPSPDWSLLERTPTPPAVPEPPATGSPQQSLPFPATDDDPTWEMPAVEPSALVAFVRRRERSAPFGTATREPPRPPSAVDAVPQTATAPRDVAPRPALDLPAPRDPLPFRLPPVDLPAGLVWPGVSGRAVLAALGAPVRITARLAPWAPAAAIELACGDGWSAHTSPELVFSDLDRGREALFEAARWQAKLAYLTPPGRTYALSPEGTSARLWVLTPAYRTVWTDIEEAFARDDRDSAGRLAHCGLEAVDELRARGVPIADLDHIAIDHPARLLATPWTPRGDRLTGQLQRLFSAAVL